jgi:hypothetical protein
VEIKFFCSCGQKIATDSSAGGQQFACPCCGVTLSVPEIVSEPNQPEPLRNKTEVLPFLQYDTAPLERLQQAGLVRKRIAQKTLWGLPQTPWRTIVNDRPELLTQEGISSSVDCDHYLRERQYVAQMDLRNIAQRSSGEKSATEKQINFLRSLGVQDEALLSSLGIRQASAVIEYVLDHKGDY